jgi:hypothetical protein
MRNMVFAAAAALILSSSAAQAYLMIMPDDTDNVTCSNGICTATARKACISVADLQAMLADGDVTLVPGAIGKDIQVRAGFTWSSGHRLIFDSFHSVNIKHPIVVQGGGGLTIVTDDGGHNGKFLFTGEGSVSFQNPESSLIINGQEYTMVSNIATLASGVASDPNGHFALAGSYDAGHDHFKTAPIPTPFSGVFEGLGNTISHLSLHHDEKLVLGDTQFHVTGLFGFVAQAGIVRDLIVQKGFLASSNPKASAGLVAGRNDGLLRYITVDGSVTGTATAMGGVVGWNNGTVYDAESAANISAAKAKAVGGVVGLSYGIIEMSHASGSVSGSHYVGGLAGEATLIESSYATGEISGRTSSVLGGLAGSAGYIHESFATGAVTGSGSRETAGGLAGRVSDIRDSFATSPVTVTTDGIVGGLVGTAADGTIDRSYAAGAVSGEARNLAGGLVGRSVHEHTRTDYWDRQTSGRREACGNDNCRGATGMTSQELQTQLPPGLDPARWAQDMAFNDGYPYLLAPLKRFP